MTRSHGPVWRSQQQHDACIGCGEALSHALSLARLKGDDRRRYTLGASSSRDGQEHRVIVWKVTPPEKGHPPIFAALLARYTDAWTTPQSAAAWRGYAYGLILHEAITRGATA